MFISTFWSCRKNGLIRKLRLISKFITSNLVNKELQYRYCAISHKVKATRIWSDEIIKQEKYFSSKIMQKMWEGDESQTSFCFFEKALFEVSASGLQLSFNQFR